MARRGKRYDSEEKLNIKKVIAVIVFILVVIMFVVGIKYLLKDNSESASGKIETQAYYTAYDNGKWGVIDKTGKLVIDASYDEMIVIPDNTKDLFICNYDINYTENTYKTKVINAKGKEIIEGYETVEAIANYDDSQNLWYEKNILKVKKAGKYGLCNFEGKEILACEYENITPVQGIENSLIIQKDSKLGLVDNSGNIVIEPKYKKIEKIGDSYKNGYLVMNDVNNYGIIGIDKTEILECKYEGIKGIASTNLFAIKKAGKTMVIDRNGETVLENGFDDVEDIKGEYIIAKKDNKYGVLDIYGTVKVPFDYDQLKVASNYYIAQKNEKYGIIDVNGNEKVAFEAIDVSYYASGDFYIVDYMENNNIISKVMDSNFETKLTGIVSNVNEEKGYLRIYTDNNYKYYNFKFEEKPVSTILTANTLFLSKKDGKYGFIDKNNKVVVDFIYDDATEQNSSGYAAVKKDGAWGSIDSKGKVVINPEYNLDNNTKIDFIGAWHICEDKNANYYLDV